MVRALKRDKGQLPSAVTIPEHIWNDGNKPWPGQDAGFLGRRHDPWLIKCYPHEDRIDVPGMTLPKDISRLRLDARQTLLQQFNHQARTLQESPEAPQEVQQHHSWDAKWSPKGSQHNKKHIKQHKHDF